ncbi:DUF262 domain-containing protein [Chrysosporum ovalisporum CS-1034]|uniref:DUF262 domain-containing protein n=1 Tax=Umezakia ovalisporum TaxID=75695 RepID=UPI0024730296|nr:DUF262 domain-containing protein [Umezakia ovalisporum]MDH6073899.1 DUF262 domain-containing protein [Umezakia ovalisporum CS-1034]
MKASETKVQDFLSLSKTQFIIPIYQRNYDWGASQCKQLLHDILEVGAKKQIKAHFIGSVVYIHDDIYTSSKTRELTIIDGQQRLTTLTIIYLVIVELAKQLGDESLVNEISETYLINKFAQEQEKLKLRSTDDNHDALKHLLKGERSEYFAYYSKIIDNFNFFKQKINKENYQTVLEGLSKLMFVEISLDRDKDDPQRIFESLNSNGLDLSQADLIRNYILMGLNRKEQKKIYQNYWEVIETLAKDESNNSRVSDYIRDYLTLENKKIPNKSQVYLEFKTKYPHTDLNNLEKNLTGLKTLAYHYNKLINPQKETDRDIRLQIEYINRLEINVAFPFLMRIYDDFIKSIIDKKIFLQILNLIQSFVWRRSIVGLQTQVLNVKKEVIKIAQNMVNSGRRIKKNN